MFFFFGMAVSGRLRNAEVKVRCWYL